MSGSGGAIAIPMEITDDDLGGLLRMAGAALAVAFVLTETNPPNPDLMARILDDALPGEDQISPSLKASISLLANTMVHNAALGVRTATGHSDVLRGADMTDPDKLRESREIAARRSAAEMLRRTEPEGEG